MSDVQHDSAEINQRRGRRERKRLAADLARAEAMVEAAGDDGIKLESADIAIIRAATGVVDRRVWSDAWETGFYDAIGRIEKSVHYPSYQVFKDMKSSDELLSHASLTGLPLASQDIEALTRARVARIERAWNTPIEAEYYAALNRISKGVQPVAAATAGKNAYHGARRAIRIYTLTAIFLTILVVGLSCLLFAVNQISDDVQRIVTINDSSAMALHNQLLSYQANIIEMRQTEEREIRKVAGSASQAHNRAQDTEEIVIAAHQKASGDLRQLSNSQPAIQIKHLLQEFATNNRQLYNDVTRTRGIGNALFLPVTNPYTEPHCPPAATWNSALAQAEHPPGASAPHVVNWICSNRQVRANLEIKIPIMDADRVTNDKDETLAPENVVDEGFQKIAAYQDIRAMAMYGREIVLSLVGAVTGFILPVLYAWLGASAAILRKIRIETETSTFHPEYSKVANRAHITCAVIVGIAIGLFSDLVQGGKNISPLAVAFIAGYASDKFFYFVDRLVDVIFPARAQVKPETPQVAAPAAAGAAAAVRARPEG
ncbi:hypothetical protein [Paraburkholderia rhizosphaerae]|uniref:Transmembrane protein n=1 Tax=Paraburkholderia rhizosphaerae TaxID=480658 RepID=A0A4R8LJN9_9BURK|nr:hypothetical protein [Paraburkholderia rhizosphaerae]TDY43236.1 hypothetical protein BX592_11831 [Paraburkholderia rhizosphaerae]